MTRGYCPWAMFGWRSKGEGSRSDGEGKQQMSILLTVAMENYDTFLVFLLFSPHIFSQGLEERGSSLFFSPKIGWEV